MDIVRRLKGDLLFRLWALKGALSFLSLAIWPPTGSANKLASIIALDGKWKVANLAQSGPNLDDSGAR